MLRLILIAVFFVVSVEGKCPNLCSGHGICGVANTCNCYPGWSGGASDCSLRNCPNGTAWADKAYALDKAHQPAECSNAGECDRSTGICKCFDGFTGSACQRTACPNDCSGHGICSTIGDVSMYSGPDYNSRLQQSGDGLGIPYVNWDKNSIQMCECDSGYFGSDCSLVMCSKGDDPLTINQNFRSIKWEIITATKYTLTGKVGLQFQGTKIYIPVSYGAMNSDRCSELLSFNGKFGLVGCTFSTLYKYHLAYELIFYNWPVYPKDNNLYTNDGNPSKYDFFCDVTYTNPGTYCVFTDIVNTDIIEYSYCSNRGNCDYLTGTCNCYDGFGGPACSNTTYLFQSGSNAIPGLMVNVNPLNFTASAFQIQTAKAPASDFNLIEAIAGSNTMFYVRGDGVVGINKLKTLSGGQTVSGGGLYIEEGGCTIVDTGINIFSSSSSTSVAKIASRFAGTLASSYSALQVSTVSTSANNHFLINGVNQGKSKFAVRADGAVFIRSGGLQVTAGVSVGSFGIRSTGGLTVNTAGINVLQGGISVSGGLSINSFGMKINSGGLQVYGGVSIYSAGFKIASGMTITSGGLSLTNGVTVNTNGIRGTGGLTINNAGAIISGGTTINSRGLYIVSGGLTLANGGAFLTSGLTVGRSAVIASGGLTVAAGGLVVSGGLTLRSGAGLYVTGNGVTILAGGLSTANGFTVTGSAQIVGGLSVSNGGVHAEGGLTANSYVRILNGGASITGGVSVNSGGLKVTTSSTFADITVTANSIFSGSTVTFVNGVVIAGALTVRGAVQFHSSPSVYSDRRLKTNLVPINDALKKVAKLNGVYFNWIQNEPSGMAFDSARHVGVIAQDVQRVLPEVVHNPVDGKYLSVDYASMVPLLIEAIHDLESITGTLLEEKSKIVSESEKLRMDVNLLINELRLLKEGQDLLRSELVALRDNKSSLV